MYVAQPTPSVCMANILKDSIGFAIQLLLSLLMLYSLNTTQVNNHQVNNHPLLHVQAYLFPFVDFYLGLSWCA